MNTYDQHESDQTQSPAEANRDKIKAYWANIPLWPKLAADLLEMPNDGRWSGVCESWHCSAWQQGPNGAARAVSVAQRYGWNPQDDFAARIESLAAGHLTFARLGEDWIGGQRELRKIQPPTAAGTRNIGEAWAEHQAKRLEATAGRQNAL